MNSAMSADTNAKFTQIFYAEAPLQEQNEQGYLSMTRVIKFSFFDLTAELIPYKFSGFTSHLLSKNTLPISVEHGILRRDQFE